nr:MAG TPA: hypothetical protein [Caudoviricetes sp.]
MYKAIIMYDINRDEYDVNTRSAIKAGLAYGSARSGEHVEIRRPRSGKVISTAVWHDPSRAYINVLP